MAAKNGVPKEEAEFEAGLDRIRQTLRSLQLWDEEGKNQNAGTVDDLVSDDLLRNHVEVVRGDLAQPNLADAVRFPAAGWQRGRDNSQWRRVNLVKTYDALRAWHGTSEALRLAATNGLNKPVHYVSTNGVFLQSTTLFSYF